MLSLFTLILFLNLFDYVFSNTLINLMNTYEKQLYDLRDKTIQYYKNCDYTCSSSSKCSIDACVNSFSKSPGSGVGITSKHGYIDQCGFCEKQTSRYLDFQRSGITNADKNYRTTNLLEREDLLCWTSQLDQDWIKNNATKSLAWQYLGTPLGIHRNYPGYPQEKCASYDPRIRSWYVAATSGPKDVIIVIDTSGSMSNENRMALVKEATKAVISTLTILDRFSIVQFRHSASEVGCISNCDRLRRATSEHKDMAVDAINELVPNGGTNMEAAFTKAFDIMDNSITNEATTGCNKIILFLTDGYPSIGKNDTELTDFVKESNVHDMVIFTYSVGTGASHIIPKDIACQNNGVWAYVKDQSLSLVTQMSHYYDYIASLRDANTNVVWVEPYEDAFGAGMMTTASLAVYDDQINPPKLLGVLGMDITIEEMEKLEPNHDTFLEKFIQQSSPSCPNLFSLSECNMELLRSKKYGEVDHDNIYSSSNSVSIDATCDSSVTSCPVSNTILDICGSGTRSSTWCYNSRNDYLDEVCIEVCSTAKAPHLHNNFSQFVIALSLIVIRFYF